MQQDPTSGADVGALTRAAEVARYFVPDWVPRLHDDGADQP